MRHPSTRAERLRLKEIKREKKLQTSEKRLERLRRKALLSSQKETANGFEDDNTGDI